jgi:hypothetical protein
MEGRGGGVGAISYDGEKAWFSINSSILSGTNCENTNNTEKGKYGRKTLNF